MPPRFQSPVPNSVERARIKHSSGADTALVDVEASHHFATAAARTFGAVLLVVACAAAAAVALATPVTAPAGGVAAADALPPTSHTIERNGLRYEFSALSGNEYLWEVAADPDFRRNLAHSRPADVRRLRELLETELHVTDIRQLHARHRATAESLRGLGYL